MRGRRRTGASGLLLPAVAVESLIAVGLGANAIGRLAAGQHGWTVLLAVAGLAWVLVVSAAVLRGVGRLGSRVADRDAQLAALAMTSHDWAWQSTPDLVLTWCSSATGELLGYQPEYLVGRSMLELVAEEDRDQARAVLAVGVQDRTGWNDVELRWRHADGHVVSLQGSAVPVLDRSGRLVGFRGTRRATPSDQAAGRRLSDLRARVRQVLDDGELQTALQPIVHLDTGRWVGGEALARFADNRPPDRHFAEAHQAGLGVELELASLQAALATLGALPTHVFMAVNASPALIVDPRFAAALTAPGVPIVRLSVEITEHAAVTSYEEIQAALLPLRERGLGLAVDDTGAGYASFHHVLRLRPDHIKLDRSLVTDLHTDPARRALITAIVLLALELNATVTGEGVETADELSALASLGVDHAQGYFIARPTIETGRWGRWEHQQWGRPASPYPSRADTEQRTASTRQGGPLRAG